MRRKTFYFVFLHPKVPQLSPLTQVTCLLLLRGNEALVYDVESAFVRELQSRHDTKQLMSRKLIWQLRRYNIF